MSEKELPYDPFATPEELEGEDLEKLEHDVKLDMDAVLAEARALGPDAVKIKPYWSKEACEALEAEGFEYETLDDEI